MNFKMKMLAVASAAMLAFGVASPASAAPDGVLYDSKALNCDNASGVGANGTFKIRNNYDGVPGGRKLILDFNDAGYRTWNWEFLWSDEGQPFFTVYSGQGEGDFTREKWMTNSDGDDRYRAKVTNGAGNVICTATIWMP